MRYELMIDGHRCRMTKQAARRCWEVEADGRFHAATLFLTRSGKVWGIEGDYQLGCQVAAAARRAGIVAT